MALDLDAPIVPGQSAAGILLGTPIDAVLQAYPDAFSGELIVDAGILRRGRRYRSPDVHLWTAEGTGGITQILVRGQYRGRIFGQIGLESSVADIERLIGPCSEDDEDNLVITGIHGLCFEIDATYADPNWQRASLSWICVYPSILDLRYMKADAGE